MMYKKTGPHLEPNLLSWTASTWGAVSGIVFYVLLTVHLGIIFVNNKIDAQLIFLYISIIYMFRAAMCLSSGKSIVSIPHLVYVTLYR